MKPEYYDLFDWEDSSCLVTPFVDVIPKALVKKKLEDHPQELLEAYVQHALEMLRLLNIEPHALSKISINKRASSFWGKARRRYDRQNGKSIYMMEINQVLVKSAWNQCEKGNCEYSYTFKPLLTVVLHEWLHCVDGCLDHGWKWQTLANKVNAMYGYNISRTSSAEALGLELDFTETYKYVLECPVCHTKTGRNTMSRAVKHPEDYHCCTCRRKGILSTIRRIK